jgi:restriction endonuclease S subunit
MALLHHFAAIFSGYTYRSQPVEEPKGEYIFLQPRDINLATHTLNFGTALKTNEFFGSQKYLLRKGDVLIVCKGRSSPAVVFDNTLKKVVASSAFVIVKPIREQLNPYYLAWYLCQSNAQNYFLSKKSGTTVLNLPIEAIKNVEIPIPLINMQETYGNLYRNTNRLKATQLEIIEKESLLIDINISQLLKQSSL